MASDSKRAIRLAIKFKSGPSVLTYHGVTKDKVCDPFVQGLQMQFSLFRKQIHYLKKYYDIISPEELEYLLQKQKKIKSNQILITFDDGYKNNASTVAPFLHSLNIPFCVFVSTKHIEEESFFPAFLIRLITTYTDKNAIDLPAITFKSPISDSEDRKRVASEIVTKLKRNPINIAKKIQGEILNCISPDLLESLLVKFSADKPMSWKDVQNVVKYGAVIGSHCSEHVILNQLSTRDEIKKQIRESVSMLKEKDINVKYFAYPNGNAKDICKEAIEELKLAKIKLAFTTIGGEICSNTNPYLIPRVGPAPKLEDFKAQLLMIRSYNKIYTREITNILSR